MDAISLMTKGILSKNQLTNDGTFGRPPSYEENIIKPIITVGTIKLIDNNNNNDIEVHNIDIDNIEIEIHNLKID